MRKLSEYVKIAEAVRLLAVSQNTVRARAEADKVPMRRNPAKGYRLFLRGYWERFLVQIAHKSKI